MHVIRERKSNTILLIDQGASDGPLPGAVFLTGFDPATMEIGWTPAHAIPAFFDIDARGHVVELSLIDLAAVKSELVRTCTQLALESRAKLLPDYKLQNAAIGVYPEEQVASFRATIDAYRAEVHRLEGQIRDAKSLAELRELAPRFPEQLLPGKA
jgi:hypothetical protein